MRYFIWERDGRCCGWTTSETAPSRAGYAEVGAAEYADKLAAIGVAYTPKPGGDAEITDAERDAMLLDLDYRLLCVEQGLNDL